jgi:predicted RNase H-like HicB family nuclease
VQGKTFEYYMDLPYAAEIWYDEDAYFAKVLELPGCMTRAGTFEELGPMIKDAMTLWITSGLEHGDPIPEPHR